ncbi:two-component response regulator ARR2 [Striga asiatica]|uniref:Two-component response regulator ARR2 n=1 Tax=Striga asiatica TaxID=4170 RepID=A0A5A7P7B0_STRAF|nr:two-component response regulator ARR2 [Striga asiatica]
MLIAGKSKFDLILANINSPDLHSFRLLQHAVAMDIPIILMGFEPNAILVLQALENGAYLYLTQPITKESADCLWQCVLREKLRLAEYRDPGQLAHGNLNEESNMIDSRNVFGLKEEDYESSFVGNVKRKVCTEWTQELHDKFVDAVQVLGEGRCFPKEILDLMNVSGLTRMQVASHLQKCRNASWRSPEERKSNSGPLGGSGHLGPSKLRRFGSMPKVARRAASEPASNESIQNGSKTGPEAQNVEPVIDNPSSYNLGYGPIAPPLPVVNGPAAPVSEDLLFSFNEMDGLVHSYTGLPAHVVAAMVGDNVGGPSHFDPVWAHTQFDQWAQPDWTPTNFGSEQDSEASEFCNLVFDNLKLKSSTNRLELKYAVKEGYPPMSIYDDNSLAFYTELKSREADYAKFPICVVVEPLIDKRDKISYECNVAPLRCIKMEDFLPDEENSMNFMEYAHKVADIMVEEAKYVEDKLYSEMFHASEDVNYPNIVVGHSFSNKAALQEFISLHAIENKYQFKVEKSCTTSSVYVQSAIGLMVGAPSVAPAADEILEICEIGNLTRTLDGARKEGKA